MGPLVAAGPVVLTAACFSNAVYERLPLEECEEAAAAAEQGQQPVVSQSSGATAAGGESGGSDGVPFYNLGGSYPFAGDAFGGFRPPF